MAHFNTSSVCKIFTISALLLTPLILSGCTNNYWVKDGNNLQKTATDLQNCRLQASKAAVGGIGP